MLLKNFRTIHTSKGCTEYKYYNTYLEAKEYQSKTRNTFIQVLKRVDMNNYKYENYTFEDIEEVEEVEEKSFMSEEELKELIIVYAKKHDLEFGVKDYNGVCHLLMYLRQDGWEQHTNFALDLVAEIIEIVFTNKNVPPIVKLLKPALRESK